MLDKKHISRKRDLIPPNDLEFGICDLRDEHIVGKKVEIGAGAVCDRLINCIFEDCELRIRGSGGRTSVATLLSQFVDCLIWPAKIQKIPTWEASFERCLIKGKFETRFEGLMKDCDFSQSVLNSASFLQREDLGNVAWPPWPHIVIHSPAENLDDWKRIPKPSEFNQFLCRLARIACVINLADAVDDPDAFWEVIKDVSYITREN